MQLSRPVTDIIAERYSCRIYSDKPIASEQRGQMGRFLATLGCGPLGTPGRFQLIAATEQQRDDLRGLGTYGLIRGATGFIVGVVREAEKDLEDFGFLMEQTVLFATDLGLGTCWLGGNFTRSSFAARIERQADEALPAVTATGYSANRTAFDPIRRLAGSNSRLHWQDLFFAGRFGNPLERQAAGPYAVPLDGVRLAPSASNKQPWRIIKDGDTWHFYLRRTRGYRDQLGARLLHVADLQRVDMGIAMCHFQLSAVELGLPGRWAVVEPPLARPDALTEYVVSWVQL